MTATDPSPPGVGNPATPGGGARGSGADRGFRVGVTVVVAAALAGILAASPHDWDFRSVWGYRALYVRGLWVTIRATLVAFAIGLATGVWVGIARGSRNRVIRPLADLYVELIRGTPFFVQVSIAYFGIAPLLRIDNKFWVGSIALGVFAAAYIGEIVRAGIESVEIGQREAARSLGLTRAHALRHVVLPQAVRRMIPPLTGELIALTKESSLLFAIGLAELTFAARAVGSSTYHFFEAYLAVAGVYLTLTIPLSIAARRLEGRFARGRRTGTHL